MKIRSIRIALLILFLTAATMFAPPPTPINVCVKVEAPDVARVSEAFGSILGLKDEQGNSRSATEVEVESAVARWLGGQTRDYEKRKNMAEFSPPPFVTGSQMNDQVAAPTPKK